MTTTKVRQCGTRAKYKAGCPCDRCRAANARYENTRVLRRAHGQEAYVDAEPVREHIRRLSEAGIGWKRVAELSGIGQGAFCRLIYGYPSRGTAPSRRVHRATAHKILAVQPTLGNVSDGTGVDATGARRRLEALMTLGWAQVTLAARLGVSRSNVSHMMHSDRLAAGTVRAVHKLYDELWATRPPEDTHRDKIAASRARRYAQEHGYVPPMAWDDDTIDNPRAKPRGLRRAREVAA